jgi:hypothetical protein
MMRRLQHRRDRVSPGALGRIWGVVGLFLAVYTFNAWSLSQGGPALGSVLLLDPRPTIACYYAIVVISISLVVLNAAGALHATKVDGGWVDRLPLVGFSPEVSATIDRDTASVKVYQAACFIIMVLLPSVALLRMCDEVMSEGVVWNREVPSTAHHNLGPIDLLPWRLEDRLRPSFFSPNAEGHEPNLRLANTVEDATHAASCENRRKCPAPGRSEAVTSACRQDRKQCNGVTWFAYVSPALLSFFLGAGWVSSLYLVYCVFVRADDADEPVDG